MSISVFIKFYSLAVQIHCNALESIWNADGRCLLSLEQRTVYLLSNNRDQISAEQMETHRSDW